MKASVRCKKTKDPGHDRNRRPASRSGSGNLLPALVALGSGCALIAGPAAALELGDVRVESSLGQPLRASIAYALNPGEQVAEHCIHLGSGTAANGLTAIDNARIDVSNGAIRLAGRAPVTEPLVAVSLSVACPGTARLTREYSLLIDLVAPGQAAVPIAGRALPAPDSQRAGIASATAAGTAATAPSAKPARSAPPAVRQPVAGGGTYRVQPGDSLSGIAARISDRTMGLWQTVDVLFAANPGAFIDGNRDLLLAGAVLVVPDAVLAGPAASDRVRVRAAEPATSAAGEPAGEPAPVEPPISPQVGDGQAALAADTAPAANQASSDRQRAGAAVPAPAEGDVALGSDGPFVSPIRSGADIATASEPGAAAGARDPEPATAGTQAAPADIAGAASGKPRTWLLWLGGSGVAVILALLLFGRQLRERFGQAAMAAYGRRKSDSGNLDETKAATVNADFATPESAFDAGDGIELEESGDIDILAEFGYSGEFENDSLSASGAVELPGRYAGPADLGATAILEKEILPSDDTGEYDLSMIVDATCQPSTDTGDATRDLQAVEISEEPDGTDSEGEYTISRETDYTILEQDYENELTATQALNAALTKAASELTLQIDEGDKTAHLPVGDATAQLPADDKDEATTVLPAEPKIDTASASTVQMQPETAAGAATDKLDETDVSEGLASDTTYAENDPGDEEAATAEKKRLKAS